MRLHQLFETPIKDIDHVGDFDKSHSWRHKRDRMLVTHPASLNKVKEKFGNTEQDINLLFVNTSAADKETEVGMVSYDYVQRYLGDEVLEALKNLSNHENAINIIFTNNKGDKRIPMTPWIMAHRIMHALVRSTTSSSQIGMDPKFTSRYYKQAADSIVNFVFDYILPAYRMDLNTRITSYNRLMSAPRDKQLAFKYLFNEIGTFRSARENNIRDWFEVFNELGAQYIITGGVKFNGLPHCFGPKNKGRRCLMDDELMIDQAESALESMGSYFERDMQTLLDHAVGKTFIM